MMSYKRKEPSAGPSGANWRKEVYEEEEICVSYPPYKEQLLQKKESIYIW